MKLLFTFIILSFNLYSQVEIIMSKEIDSLIKLRCDKTKNVYYMIPGWRVQLECAQDHDDDVYNKLVKKRKQFITYHPEISTYLFFDAPNWILRVGDFSDKNDAEKLIKEIRIHYPNLILMKAPVFKDKEDEHIREESTE